MIRIQGRFYYGWGSVVTASIAMTATFPGRTHGLGMVTEPLIADLGIAREEFTRWNLIATIVGAGFCLPIGWLIDRYGVRIVSTLIMLFLGGSSLLMASVQGPWTLLAGLVLMRGFGQSALSIASMAIIGKWFRRRLGVAMGVFTVLLTIGFIASILGMEAAIQRYDWRDSWNTMSWTLVSLAPLMWMLVRNSPEACGIEPDGPPLVNNSLQIERDLTLSQALRTPAFWVFTLGSSIFNLVWSAVTLLNESILAERGYDREGAMHFLAYLTAFGLLANLLAGWLTTRNRLGKLLGLGLFLLSASLFAYPSMAGENSLKWFATALGMTGGLITVVHFAAWGHLFGRSSLGRIQAVGQLVSVFASAAGPELFALSQSREGNYAFVFQAVAGVVAILALCAWLVPIPRRELMTEPGSPVILRSPG